MNAATVRMNSFVDDNGPRTPYDLIDPARTRTRRTLKSGLFPYYNWLFTYLEYAQCSIGYRVLCKKNGMNYDVEVFEM